MLGWSDYFYKLYLINMYNHEDKIDWKLVSGHPYLPIHLVEAFPDKPWDWRQLSRLPFQSIQRLILLYPNKQWDWHVLTDMAPTSFKSIHTSFPWINEYTIVRKYSFETNRIQLEKALSDPHLSLWNWKSLSHHPSLTMDIVCQYPQLNWDMCHVLTHFPFSSYHLDSIATTNHNYYFLSKNPYNTIQKVCRHKTKPWDWSELAQNAAFAPHNVHRHRNELPMWRWDLSLRNPRLTWDFYHMIRKEKKIPRQSQHLFRNHFHHSKPLHAYCRVVVRRFLIHTAHKRILLRKLRLLHRIRARLGDDTMRSIIFEFI